MAKAFDTLSRPGRKTGARIETIDARLTAQAIHVAPVARPGRGLKHRRRGHPTPPPSRPGRKTGARIETASYLWYTCWCFSRPGRKTGARIETGRRVRHQSQVEGRPGRKTGARIETQPEAAALLWRIQSPRSQDRGA